MVGQPVQPCTSPAEAADSRLVGREVDRLAEHVLIQISDIHLTSSGSLLPGVRPRDNLIAGLTRLAEAHLEPEMFILTGDLADTGEPSCYEDLAQIMDTAAMPTGANVV